MYQLPAHVCHNTHPCAPDNVAVDQRGVPGGVEAGGGQGPLHGCPPAVIQQNLPQLQLHSVALHTLMTPRQDVSQQTVWSL